MKLFLWFSVHFCRRTSTWNSFVQRSKYINLLFSFCLTRHSDSKKVSSQVSYISCAHRHSVQFKSVELSIKANIYLIFIIFKAVRSID